MTDTLKALSEALADVVENAAGSVLRIEARRRLPATGIAWSQEGLIVTASHVVRRDEGVLVGLPSGENAPASLVGRDPTTDLAVLRVDGELPYLPDWHQEGELRVGNIVLALGRPGSSIQATLGVVSALGPAWRTPAGGELSAYVQTDVVMYPGFSGGPLVTATGEFAGLNTSALMRGVSVTVSAANLRTIVDELQEHGRVRRGYLGVNLQVVRLPGRVEAELGQKTGLLIAGIEEGSPAAAAGLFQGDILVSAEGSPLRHMDDLFLQLRGDRVGQRLLLIIIRAGEQLEVKVELGSRDSE